MSPTASIEISYAPFPTLEEDTLSTSPIIDDANSEVIPPIPARDSSPPNIEPPHNAPPQAIPPQPAVPIIPASPLNSIPVDIAFHRSLLFALDTPVTLAPPVWQRFWPYIDNVWCVHQKPHPSPATGIAKVYGGCRLNRKTNFPPPVIHENSRPRQRREGGTCKAKFRLIIHPDGRRVVERTGEGHSHTLEHIDSIKRNTSVRNLVLDSFFKSWEAGGILAFLRDTSATLPHKPLTAAGGLYLSRQEVQNILNGALKRAYPGQDVSEVKKQMDKYKNYTTCNYKGCNAPAFADPKALMEHRKSVHGLKSHDHSDKQYACPDKNCWRRKKSKGFATLLGLEEHIKDKHPASATSTIIPPTTNIEEIDPTFSALSPSSHNIDFSTGSLLANTDPLLPDNPNTPDSSTEDQRPDLQLNIHDLQVEAQEATRALTQMEKEAMLLRIQRLRIEREKLDAEIKKLNKAVWGDERGDVGDATAAPADEEGALGDKG